MIYAKDKITGEKIKATPNAKAVCEHCNDEVIAKCGDVISWHWAHSIDSTCDYKTVEKETRRKLLDEPLRAIGWDEAF